MTTGNTEIDLGNGVTLKWIHHGDESNIVGAAICHPTPDGRCCGAIGLRGKDPDYEGDTWEFDGDYNSPTLLPSVLCGCGFHGYVTDGKWKDC